MEIGKLYKCVHPCRSTSFNVKPGEIIMPFEKWEFTGRKRSATSNRSIWRAGVAFKFLKGAKISQVRFVSQKPEDFFVAIK